MIRPWHIWTIFGVCLAVVLAAVAWLSVTAVRLENDATSAQQRAILEENVRLALWRADSALAPLLARENARPYFVYKAFYPAERAYTRMFSAIDYGDVLVPSPLLSQVSAYILLHFQIDADGVFSSPQAPRGNMRDLAEAAHVASQSVDSATSHLAQLEALVGPETLLARLAVAGPGADETLSSVGSPTPGIPLETARGMRAPVSPPVALQQQMTRNWMETAARGRVLQPGTGRVRGEARDQVARQGGITEGSLGPLWLEGELILARTVSVGDTKYVQGCWLDWPKIQRWLSAEVADLFPEAHFEPAETTTAGGDGRMLASLPVRLEPGAAAIGPDPVASPVGRFLLAMWVCVLLAGVAVAALLSGIVSLSERRGAFVSAVTHELRTPLTTFRLYTDMLAAGLITDHQKQREYLHTLHTEATRLAHLVENVLAYARLERGGAPARSTPVPTAAVLERACERLADRAAQAGMRLDVMPLDAELGALQVRADPAAVEQILFNLVDNACKYAASADKKVIRIAAVRCGTRLAVRVRDHGPGIARAEARRLFKPFRKSARDAAGSVPGVGLGLALSRRLARRMGGDLRLVRPDGGPGACFELSLQLVARIK